MGELGASLHHLGREAESRRILAEALEVADRHRRQVPTAAAQEQAYDSELAPYGGYRFGGTFAEAVNGTTIELDDSESFGLIFNARHSPVTQWEVLYAHQETSAETTGIDVGNAELDLGIDYLHGGGTYLFDGTWVRPFLSATVGMTRIDVQSAGFDDDAFFSFSMGLGIQLRPTERLGLRLEARGFGTVVDSDTDLFCRTGPDENVCAVRIDGDVMWQMEAIAGVVFRF